MEGLLSLDTQLFLAINGWHSGQWDPVMWWCSGKLTWWPFYLLLLLFLGWKKGWQLIPLLLFMVVLVALTDQTSVHLFKNVFQRPRPCHEPALKEMVHLVNGRCGGLYGFISSHAANTAGVAMLVCMWLRRSWLAGVLAAWVFMVGYSRIYLGVHYPGDVLGGWLWGLACGWLVYGLFRMTMKQLPSSWRIADTSNGPFSA